MNEFLQFIDKLTSRFPVHVEITYSKVMNWCIYVYKRGCAKDYPKSPKSGEDVILCRVQSGDMALCFARAQCAVKEWLSEYEGGY